VRRWIVKRWRRLVNRVRRLFAGLNVIMMMFFVHS